jgi:hypothetical protein
MVRRREADKPTIVELTVAELPDGLLDLGRYLVEGGVVDGYKRWEREIAVELRKHGGTGESDELLQVLHALGLDIPTVYRAMLTR